jgi:hypothetical protein
MFKAQESKSSSESQKKSGQTPTITDTLIDNLSKSGGLLFALYVWFKRTDFLFQFRVGLAVVIVAIALLDPATRIATYYVFKIMILDWLHRVLDSLKKF